MMSKYARITPSKESGYVFRAGLALDEYNNWAEIGYLSRFLPTLGLNENRGGDLISMDSLSLERRMHAYFDTHSKFEDIESEAKFLTQQWSAFNARRVRARLLSEYHYSKENIKTFLYRPYDMRWAYVTEAPSLWNRSRPELQHLLSHNEGFITTRLQRITEPEGYPTCYTRALADQHAQDKDIYLIPFVENLSGAPRPNISDAAAGWLEAIGLARDINAARLMWHHALAITYSTAYLAENAGGIRQGWPRIPLPDNADTLRASAALGAQLAALLDSELPVPGATTGTIRPELLPIAVPVLPKESGADWSLSGWGNRTDKGITMPGRGRVESRPYSSAEAATASHAALLGATTNDIGLDAQAHWRNIPEKVWECRIGGYQVLKKWLSYRDASIIKRPLTPDEVAHIQNTARRLAAILLLGPELDASYRACAASHRPLG